MILCRTLGPVEVSVDGGSAPPELLWRKNLALLVYLARSPKRARTREHLIGLLWGDKPEAAARHSLNEALRVIRRHLGEGGIETEGELVRLLGDAVQLDTEWFETLAEKREWRSAAELLAGEFMEGFAVPGAREFEDWLSAERLTWRERSVDALVRCADAMAAGGRVREAHDTALRALRLDPASDAGARAVMKSLALAGDRAGALQVYEAFAGRVEEDLGIEPDIETRALVDRIRRERSWRLPEGLAPEAVRGAESRRAPLVGRERELEQLLTAWTSCRVERRPAVGVVEGDVGTGKTRLAEEVLARARLDGAATAALRAVAADLDEAWSAVFGLARGGLLDAAGLEDAPVSAIAAFAAHLPEWAARLPGAIPKAEPPALGRALCEVLRAVASEQPALLWVDDAHWLDRDSLLALERATRELAQAPLFLLFGVVPHAPRGELDELRVRIGRDLAGAVVQLSPLPAQALRALARWALPAYGEVEIDRVTRRVATDSAGLPLLAVELLHAVALGLDLHASQGAWPEPFRTLDDTLPGDLPDPVVAAIRIGFRRLTKPAQTVCSAAAVLGDRVTARTLGLATGLTAEEVTAALDELEWQRWLTAEPRGYSFVARIVRDVVVRDMLTPGQKQRIEERIASEPSSA